MDNHHLKIIIMGTPNSGKSTVFNTLTHSRQMTGNWAGTTTEAFTAEAKYKEQHMELTDMPGMYNMDCHLPEEKAAGEYLKHHFPDAIMLVLEPLNLERGLYLALQARERFQNILIVINKTAVAEHQGVVVDVEKLAKLLGLPVEVFNDRERVKLLASTKQLAAKEEPGPVYASCENDVDEQSRQEIARQRYSMAVQIAAQCIRQEQPGISRSEHIDKWLLHPYWGLPIMCLIFGLLFYLTFAVSKPLSEDVSTLFDMLGIAASSFLPQLGLPSFVTSMVANGLIKGIGATLTFLPQMVVFFLVYSLIQDSGYIVRVAFLMDRIMSMIGLNGKFFLPLIVGCSCNVNGVLASRVLSSRYDHVVAILISSFAPCSARMGVIVFLVAAFFSPEQATMVLGGLIIIVVLLMAIVAYVTKFFIPKEASADFMMELPAYQLPRTKDLFKNTVTQTGHFLARIKNVIIYSSVLMWFLSSYPQGPFSGTYIAQLGKLLEPFGSLLGLNWQLIVALLLGVAAKETTLTALGIMYHAAEAQGTLAQLLTANIDPLAGFTFILVYMTYIPCVATVVTVYQETNDWRVTAASVGGNLFLAFMMGICVYNIGRLLFA